MFRQYVNLAGKSTYYFTSIDELEENAIMLKNMKVCKSLLESLLSPYNGAKYKKIVWLFLVFDLVFTIRKSRLY